MAHATVRRITGKQFIGIDSTNHSVVLSTAAEGVGVKPSEMLLGSSRVLYRGGCG